MAANNVLNIQVFSLRVVSGEVTAPGSIVDPFNTVGDITNYATGLYAIDLNTQLDVRELEFILQATDFDGATSTGTIMKLVGTDPFVNRLIVGTYDLETAAYANRDFFLEVTQVRQVSTDGPVPDPVNSFPTPPLPVAGGSSSSTTIYVDTTGSDADGNGSIGSPYLTISHALTTLTPTALAPASIVVGPGTYAASFDLPPFFTITGVSQDLVRISGLVGVNDTGWNAGSGIASLENLTLMSPTILDFTGVGVQPATATLNLTNVRALDTVQYTAFAAANTLNVTNSVLAASFTQVDGTVVFADTYLDAGGQLIALAVSDSAHNTTFSAFGGGINSASNGNDISITANTHNVDVLLDGCGVTNADLTLSGATATYTATAEGVPPNVTLGGATLDRATSANALGYVATTGADWADPDPTDLQTAVDRIAAYLATTGGGPIPV